MCFSDFLKYTLEQLIRHEGRCPFLHIHKIYRRIFSSARKLALHHEDAMLFSCRDARFVQKIARGHHDFMRARLHTTFSRESKALDDTIRACASGKNIARTKYFCTCHQFCISITLQ